MKPTVSKDLLKRMLKGKKLPFKSRKSDVLQAEMPCDRVELHMGRDNQIDINFYNGKLHLASMGPIEMSEGYNATITGLKCTLEVSIK